MSNNGWERNSWGENPNSWEWDEQGEQQPTQQFPVQNHEHYEQQSYGGYRGVQEYDGSRGGNNKTVAILSVILGILVLALVLAIASYFFFFKGSGSSSSDAQQSASGVQQNQQEQLTPEATGQAVSPQTQPQPTQGSAARPQYPSLPAYAIPANTAARNNEPAGSFNNVYVSGPTSYPFAREVRDQFYYAWTRNHQTNQIIEAYSSITGITYQMECRDNGDYIHCRGGDNANVYIA